MAKNCKKILENGEQCGGYNITDSKFCFSHDPNSRDLKELAVRKGGLTVKKNSMLSLPVVQIQSKSDVPKLLTTVIAEVREGTIDLKAANTLGYLAGILIKAYELVNMEERIEEIEKVVLERRRTY